MEVVKQRIILHKKDDHVYIEPMGCIHIGNVNFDEQKFLERVDYIRRDPNRYWIGMGDYADAITVGAGQTADKRWNIATIDKRFLTPDEQYAYVKEKFGIIKSKCFGLLEGNHDYALEERSNHGWVPEMAKELQTRFLGYAVFLLLEFEFNGKLMGRSVIFAGHSHYGGARPGGNLNKLEDLAKDFEADVYLTGHTHNLFGFKRYSKGLNRDGVAVDYPKIFASTGTFMRSYVTGNLNYAEKNLSGMKKTGTITISFHPATGKINFYE